MYAHASTVFRVLLIVCAVSTAANAAADDVVWLATYDGPAHGRDIPVALALDQDGNVYVTGYVCAEVATNDCADYDIALIKYDQSGVEQWSATWGGAGGDDDYPTALALDSAGDAYISGRACVEATSGCLDWDWLVLKFSNAGEFQWADVLGGDTARVHEGASDIAVSESSDNAIAVYAVGWIYDQLTNIDYTLIRYNPDGTREWVQSLDGYGGGSDAAYACAIGPGGDLYTTGEAYQQGPDPTSDFLTTKYSPAGSQGWERMYDSPFGLNDLGRAVAVGADGSVVASGDSCLDLNQSTCFFTGVTTVKYDQDGNQAWVKTVTLWAYTYFKGLALDPTGNVHLLCSSDYYYFTSAFDAAGETLWSKQYYGFPEALAADDDGHTYVTGFSTGITTLEYDELGHRQWVANYPPGGQQYNATGEDLVVDDQGYVYVTGDYYGEGNNGADFVTIKYDPACQGCFIDQECFQDNDPNPANQCQVCDVERAREQWSNRDNGTACNDELWCTVGDACQEGVCVNEPRDCDDGLWCTGVESCDEQYNYCKSTGSPCENYEVCVEQGQACLSGGPPDDDDDDDDDACGEDGPRGAQRSSVR